MKAHPNGTDGAKDAVAYADLLEQAHGEGLKSIRTELLAHPSDENGRRCIVKAVVEVEKGHFEGLGDADPQSVEPFLVPHLIRVAETRAKARALRDAVNVGIVSFEELDGAAKAQGYSPGMGAQAPVASGSSPRPRGNGSYRSQRAPNRAPEPMSEGQRRYLFRLVANQGYHREAAEERIKQLFEVSALSEITKPDATAMIHELLQSTAPERGGGASGAARPQP